MKWKHLFQHKILDRGLDYYENGYVVDFKFEDDEITAKVDGSEIYDVVITIDASEILDMECSCPYADDGNNCKHMAAVLFYFDELFADEDENEGEEDVFTLDEFWRGDFSAQALYLGGQKEERAEAEALVTKIPDEKIKELLVDFILADDDLKHRLQMQYAFKMDAKFMKSLKKELDQIVCGYSGYSKDGFIDWRHAYDFAIDLTVFLDTKVMPIIERHCLREAFELTNAVFLEIGTVDMDDSDGGYSVVAGKCYDYWLQIAEQSDKAFQTEMAEWFETHKKGYVFDFLEDYIEAILLEVFATDEMLETEMQKIDAVLNANLSHDSGFHYNVQGGRESLILKRVEYMKQLHCTEEEIQQYRKVNRRFFAIRELEIAEAIEQKDYHTAIRLLAESKALDVKYTNQVEKYMKQLIDLYEKTDAVEDYCAELKEYLLHFRQHDLTYVKKLKAKITDFAQWNLIVDEIAVNNYNEDFVCRLLYAEQRYEQLMQTIEHSRYQIELIDAYEKVLRKRMPDRVINIYVAYLEREARSATDRNRYRRLMDYLKKIAKCDGGGTVAKNIAEAWKQDYKRRTAMMDELRKAGF